MPRLDKHQPENTDQDLESDTRRVWLRVEHRVPWRLWANRPETIFYGLETDANTKFVGILKGPLEKAGINYKVVRND